MTFLPLPRHLSGALALAGCLFVTSCLPAPGTPSLPGAGSPGPSPATSPQVASISGLVAAYGFDEGSGTTVRDAAGTNHGTVTGATWATGRTGRALSFSGAGKVVVPDAAALDLSTALTVEAWVRPASTKGWQSVLTKVDGAERSYSLYAVSSTTGPGALARNTSGTAFSTYRSTKLTAGTWAHVAATFDGTTLRTYVNGTLAASKAMTGTVKVGTGALVMGVDAGSGWFSGTIDDVRVYNRALAASEITTDMSTPVPVPVTTTTSSSTTTTTLPPTTTTTTTTTVPSGPLPLGEANVGAWPTIAFSDDFSAGTAKWQRNWRMGNDTAISPPANKTYEAGCWDPANTTTRDGMLVLRAEARTCTDAFGTTRPYATGGATTGTWTFTYGYAEARIFLPADANGQIANFPAFWINGLPNDSGAWPAGGEIDVIEGLSTHVPCWHYHWSADGTRAGAQSAGGCPAVSANGTGWHTYGVEWSPGRLDYFYDGRKVATHTTGVVSSKMYLALDNAVPARWTPTLPAEMLVDYVRVWQR